MDHWRNAGDRGRFALVCGENHPATRKENRTMKTKLLWFALAVSTPTIADSHPTAYTGAGGNLHRGTVTRAPARVGGVSSMRSMPTRSFRGTTSSSLRRYSSVGTRPSRSPVLRRTHTHSSLQTYTRSGPFTAATISNVNRFPRVATHTNLTATIAGHSGKNGRQFRNGNNRLRADWHKHVFAQRSGDWHRDWDHHGDHWWNGHRCSFINGVWVVFDVGFDPWWSYPYYPADYAYGFDSPYSGYDHSYSYDYNPSYDDPADYQRQIYDDQNSDPDQSQSSYDSMVYKKEVDLDQTEDWDSSGYATVVAAQERLARQGYYHGETDGTLNPETQ